MKKYRYEQLLNSLATMAREPSPDGSFRVSKLQPLKTLFCDLEAYRAFVALVLTEVQAEVVQSAYSPLIPLVDKIRLFEQVRQAVAEFDGSNVTQLKELGQQLYDLQPDFKRVWVHSSRRKGRDRQLLLLEYAVKSLVADRAGSGFQLVCHYLSTVKEDQFKFAPNAGERLSKIESFWKEHPPQFTEQPVRIIKLLSSLPPLPPHLELVPKPPPESEAAQAAERIKCGEQCYQPGDWVMHESFGRGMVTKVKDAARRVTIKFIHRSPRELLTTVAPMWPIPEPDKDDSALPELSPVVLEVLHHAKKPTEGIFDDDELEELEDQVEVKLAKAAYNLAKAKKHFTTFIRIVGCTRFYEADDDLSNCITRLKGAKNRVCEAWLFRNGYPPNGYDDRHTLARRFATEAPRALLRKAELLEQKLTLLLYGDVYTDDAWDGVVAPPEQRLEEVAVCLAEVENFYHHVKLGNELQPLRWERNNDFQPGQWVLTLSNQPIMYCERNLSLTRWLTHEKLVVVVNSDEVVLRSPYRRRMERISADSVFMRPSPRSTVDMTTAFMERRTWFESHKEFLRGLIPCPCCGYPLLTNEGAFEWCSLCCWEDDGQDDHNADDVRGDPNGNLSLSEARKNFEVTFCMFRLDDPEIESIQGCRPENLPWKHRLIGLYDQLITVDCASEAETLWEEIERCWGELRNEECDSAESVRANIPSDRLLGRRYLKSFASGTAHMFASSATHYAWLAHHYGCSRVTIDLLTLEIEPAEFNIKRNQILAEMCRNSLLRSIRRLKPPAVVTSAHLIAEFGIQDYAINERGSESIGRSTTTVILTDDRGKEWAAVNCFDRMLAQGDGFGDPNR